MPKIVRTLVTVAVALAWAVMLLDVTPASQLVNDAMGRLALLVAGVGSMGWVFRRLMCPAHELYLAGKIVGRAEVQAERDANVTNLEERRALRAVSKS